MKKILIIFIIIPLYINIAFGFLPIQKSDIIIGKVNNVKIYNDRMYFKYNNYINFYIDTDNFKTYVVEDVLFNRNNLLSKDKGILSSYLLKNFTINNGDIIVSSRFGNNGLLKIGCENNLMYIEGKSNKVFGSVFENGNNKIYITEMGKYNNGVELLILKEFNNKIGGCEKIDNFFDYDRTFEDLFGKDLRLYILYFIFLLGLILFLIFNKFIKK